MTERALAFDQVPTLIVSRRRKLLDGAGNEIGNDGIDRDPRTGDQDPRLARSAEIRSDAPVAKRICEGQRRVHLAHRAIGADAQEAMSGTRVACADAEIGWRFAHIE